MTKIFLATLLAFTATPVPEPITIASTVQTADLDLRVRRASRRSIAAWHLRSRKCAARRRTSTLPARMQFAAAAPIRAKVASERDERIARASGELIEVAAR